MAKAVNELFSSIDTKKKMRGIIDPKKFISSVKKNNSSIPPIILDEFNNEDHHDSHEFLIWLLDNIHENMKKEITQPALPVKLV